MAGDPYDALQAYGAPGVTKRKITIMKRIGTLARSVEACELALR